jgi:hypothetical protein
MAALSPARLHGERAVRPAFALSEAQCGRRLEFRELVSKSIAPHASRFDAERRIPRSVFAELASIGALGIPAARRLGSAASDMVAYGLLHEEIGRACSSVRSALIVHDIVGLSIARWGRADQRERWLPRLQCGDALAAFALTEPEIGSDAAGIRTRAERTPGGFVLSGAKCWVTHGLEADLFLVFARAPGGPTAFLVERDAPSLRIAPSDPLLGLCGAMLADLRFEGTPLAAQAIVGREGLGISHVASAALDLGRYAVAAGCTGMLAGCFEASLAHARTREQFGAALVEHQLIRRLLTRSATALHAARLLCRRAGALRDAGDPRSLGETMVAKYFASSAAADAARDAVQIGGAAGCRNEGTPARFLRDAKVMEIIEGSTEIHELTLPDFADALLRGEP